MKSFIFQSIILSSVRPLDISFQNLPYILPFLGFLIVYNNFVFKFSNGDIFTNILNGATNIVLISILNSKIQNTSNFKLKYIACETMITILI
jgi:hypothetical protein